MSLVLYVGCLRQGSVAAELGTSPKGAGVFPCQTRLPDHEWADATQPLARMGISGNLGVGEDQTTLNSTVL